LGKKNQKVVITAKITTGSEPSWVPGTNEVIAWSDDPDEQGYLDKFTWALSSKGVVDGSGWKDLEITGTLKAKEADGVTVATGAKFYIDNEDGTMTLIATTAADIELDPVPDVPSKVQVIDLSDLKVPNLFEVQTKLATATAKNAGLGVHLFAVWPKVAASVKSEGSAPNNNLGTAATIADNAVGAFFTWKAAGKIDGKDVAAHYDSVLVIKAGKDVTKIQVKGDAPTSSNSQGPKVIQIKFESANGDGIPVEWDGGKIVGQAPRTGNAAGGCPKPQDKEDFLAGWETPASNIDNISIISGSITAYSRYILKGVGGNGPDPEETDNLEGENLIGHWNPGLAMNKSITLIHKGSVAALEIVKGAIGAVGVEEVTSINSPNNGTYTITADGYAFSLTGPSGASALVIGNTAKAGPGKIVIQGQEAATSGSKYAAIYAPSVKVNGWPIGDDKGVVVRSKGAMVVEATGTIEATDAVFQHAAVSGIKSDAAVVFKASGAVTLTRVKVNNGSTGNVAGSIVGTDGKVTIDGGSFAPATGGLAISTTGDVDIKGARISSSGAATVPGYVVFGNVVTLKSTASESGVVQSANTGATIGGIFAKKNVVLETEFSATRAEVTVAGTADGIYIQTSTDKHLSGDIKNAIYGTPLVKAKGNASSSVEINVASGQAINVRNFALNGTVFIDIADAKIYRSQTGNTVTAPLVNVIGGDVFVKGTNLNRMTMTAGANVAISAQSKGTTGLHGGNVWIDGGNIAGAAAGAVVGKTVKVVKFGTISPLPSDNYPTGSAGTNNTLISSSGASTINSINDVVVNNGFAKIVHSGTTADDPSKKDAPRVAVIYSSLGNIDVDNVDTVKANAATGLLTVTNGKYIKLYGGKVISAASYAINSAGPVEVDWAKTGLTGIHAWDLTKHDAIEVLTGSSSKDVSAIYAPYPEAAATQVVKIGNAWVKATNTTGGAAAIVVNKGVVTVKHKKAQVVSQSGTGIRVFDANAVVEAGEVLSNPASGDYAGIWVSNGNVWVGATKDYDGVAADPGVTLHGTEPTATDFVNDSRVSSNGSLAIKLEGGGEKGVHVGYFGILAVKNSGTSAGMIKVTNKNTVTIEKNAQLKSEGAAAFAIAAEEGDITINGGRIESLASKEAISTRGGNIIIGANLTQPGSYYRDIDGGKNGVRITGDAGVLVYAKKNDVTKRAGLVTVKGGFIYNKQGTGVWAEDSLYVQGGEIVTDRDTAVRAGTSTTAGLIRIGKFTTGEAPAYWPHVWAANDNGKKNPVAVAARMVYVNGGVIEANTIRSAADNTSTYKESKATGIFLKKGPGTPVFEVGAQSESEAAETNPTTIIAHGDNTAIDCQDSSVTLEIRATKAEKHPERFRVSVNGNNLGFETLNLPGTVSIKSGDNGTAVRSVGEIKVRGTVIDENSRGDAGVDVGIWIATGDGPKARAISMPVPDGSIKHKDLTLDSALVEAGSQGAVAIDASKKAIVRVDHSVVLVRHLSTGINGLGGVYIDGGYVEVLATENNTSGTAVTGRDIRISGGQGEDDDIDKSEIHSKGIAVLDNVEGAIVQVTGRIHMSGSVMTNMKVGASVVTDTGILTMGSVQSRNLWRLSTVSDATIKNEQGKSLTIPLGVTVEVGDNGSRLKTEKSDTIKVEGVVTTVGRQAGAQFINTGRVIVAKDGNVKFNKGDSSSFKNTEGAVIVLKTGSKLDDSVLVHDTGIVNERKAYTFLKWAKILSGDTAWAIGSRGPGSVVIPPMYANLYGNQRLYVDEDDIAEDESDYWTAESKRVDSVYTAKFVKYPLDRRYKPYFETEDFRAEGDFTLGGQGTVKVDEDGTVMLTSAGTFQRTARMINEAGEGTKVYTHIVEKVDLNRIIVNQTDGPIFFDGFFYNKNRRVVDHDGEDTVLVRDGNVQVKYTGNTAQLLDGLKGAAIEGYTDLSTDKPIYFTGWGTPTFWYKGGDDDTFYPLTSSVPMNVGTYEVLASFAEGNNFVAVPSEPKSIVTIGTVEVVEGDLMSVFNQKDNDSYQIVVDLEAKVAKSGVKVALPSVLRFGAKYDSEALISGGISGPAYEKGALVGLPTIPDSMLTFSVNSNTAVGEFIAFVVPITSTAEPKNLADGNYITVRARFLSKEDMKEIKPTYITVDYRNVKLNGLLVGTTYTINGETLVATSSDTTIKEDWIGKTIQVVAQPGVGSYKTASDVANIVIGPRQLVTDSLKAVTGENAKTNISVDGRLTGTSVAMEYKLASDTIWTPATAVVTTGLKTGTYNVRLAPTASAFPSESVSVAVGFDKEVKVLESDREIPNKSVVKEVAVAPVAKVTASFTAGPSPVSKNAGSVKFFSSKQVKSGTLYVFDATGKSVAKIKAKSNGREIGAWNLRDKKGAVVAEGSYVVKGKIVGKDGTKENVSTLFSVVK
jgi:hypothetical protein